MLKEYCPSCLCEDYKVQDYEEENFNQSKIVRRDWHCKCSKCKTNFTITYFYKLEVRMSTLRVPSKKEENV